MENYYEVLHVANFAEIEVVKAAYRAVTKLYHPDTNPKADPNMIVKINLAYEVLGDLQKKEDYDRQLREYLRANKKTSNTAESNAKADFKKEYHVDESVGKKPIEKENESKEPKTKIGRFARTIGNGLWGVVDAFMEGARELQKEAENAYYQGCDFDDWTLVRRYLKSTGPKRRGYSKVLIERGLLHEKNGELIPSYEFKNIARYM